MPYISSVERIGFRRGVSEGRQEGIQVGRQEGIQAGRQEGIQAGRQEGVQVGRHEGILEGLLEAIEMGLALKFGSEGIRLLPTIRQIRDTECLDMIKQIVKTTDDLSEVEAFVTGQTETDN